jgi:hypothetical protein
VTLLQIVERERRRALRLLRASVSARAAAALVAVLSVGALALGGSRWITLPRLVPFAVWVGGLALAAWIVRRGARAYRNDASPTAIATAVEREQALRRGSLRGLVELADNHSAFVHRASDRLAARLAPLPSPLAPTLERALLRGALRGAAVTVPAVLIGTLVAARAGDGWRALAHPVDAWRGALLAPIAMVDVPTRLLRGSSFALTIRAEGRRTVVLRRRSTGNAWVETPLTLTAGTVTTELGPLDADVTLVASDGRAASDTAVIRVVDRPFLGDVSVRMTFPGYLKRSPETVPANAMLRLPAGTALEIQGHASEPLAAVTLSRGRDSLRLAPDGRRFSGRFVPTESGSWEWSARGRTTQIADVPPPLSIEVVPDSAPVAEILAPMADSLVEPDGRVAVELLASDDHALESVVLRISRVDAAGRVETPTAQALGGAGLADWAGSFTLDLARFRLGAGEAVRLQVVAFDASPKRMQGASRELTLKVPATEEQRLAARAAADSAAARVAALSKAVAELQQRTEQAANQRVAQAAGQQPMEFEKAQQAQALAQQQKEMAQRVQQMSQAARDIEKRLREAGALDTSLARQLQQAQDLMRQALTPEMLEALKKLDNSSQQLAGEQARQSLAELAEQQKRMREALEKSAEILKRAALEGAMQTLKDEATELAKQQRERGDSGRAATADELKRLEQRTQQLSKDLEALRDRLEKARADTAAKQAGAALDEARRAARALDEALQNRGQQPGQQGQQQAQQQQQMGAQGQQGGAQQGGQQRQSGQQGQQQAGAQGQQQAGAQGQQQAGAQGQQQAGAQGQQGGQQGQGAAGADQAADALQRAAQALAEGRKAQVAEWKNEVTGEIDRSLQEMLQLARQQDELAAKARRDPNATTLRSEQGAIEQGVQKAAERLADEARRSALVSQGSQRAMSEAQQRVSQAAREAGDPRTMAQAPSTMADAAVALRLVASALARDRERANTSQSASGLPELLAQLQQLAQQQGGLNGQMQSLLQLAQQQARSGEGLGDVREQARQLSRSQREVAQQLAEVGDADQSGRAAELAREARQLAQALEQGAVDPAVLERQQRLFRRMLDAGRTLENDKQDESAKRESRPGDQSNPFLPPDGPAGGRSALKYRVPDWSELRGLSPEERRLVIDYFRRLNGGERP